MNLVLSEKSLALQKKPQCFTDRHICPNENKYKEELDTLGKDESLRWHSISLIRDLKEKARELGLWDLFLPPSNLCHDGLSNLDSAPLCEIIGPVT